MKKKSLFTTDATTDTAANARLGCAFCAIVPVKVLNAHARHPKTSAKTRKQLRDTVTETKRLRALRDTHRINSVATPYMAAKLAATITPRETVFDCENLTSLPGKPIAKPANSKDPTVRTINATTTKVAEFYKKVFGRNSVDNAGADLVSSVHYSLGFDNAFWNGGQMVYGDGDGKLFIDFYKSPDVIGHELTHGVTQHESGLVYAGEPGALNESISDVFGAVFRQWLLKLPASNENGWLIGSGILGKDARAKGKTCLRDMLHPGGKHCLSPQPESYKKFIKDGDVHENSGIPSKAFALFARSVGGKSWDLACKVWYQACINQSLKEQSTFADFARLTRVAAKAMGGAELDKKLAEAWKAVDVASK